MIGGGARDLAQGGTWRNAIFFGAPLVLAMGFHSAFNLVDLFFVGKLGTDAIAGITIATTLAMLPTVIFNGLSSASIALIARSIGFRNYRRANETARQSLLLSIPAFLLLGLPGFLFARPLVMFMNARGGAIAPAVEYFKIMQLGALAMFLLMQVTAVFRAAGNAFWPMVLLIAANLLNVVGDYVLIFGKWGFPRMGVAGAAWATVITRALAAGVGVFVLSLGVGNIRIHLYRWRLYPKLLWTLAKIGLPGSGQWVLRVLAYLVLANIAGRFGTEAYAAYGEWLRLDNFAIFTSVGWGMAAATIVGQCLGRGDRARAEKSVWVLTFLNVLTLAVFAIGYALFAEFLVRFFGIAPDMALSRTDPRFDTVVKIGGEFIRRVAVSYVFAAVVITLSQALVGAACTTSAMVIDGLIYLVVQGTLAWFLALHTSLGLAGVHTAIVVSNLLGALVFAWWFRRGRWKTKIV